MIPSYCAIGIFFGIFWGVCVLACVLAVCPFPGRSFWCFTCFRESCPFLCRSISRRGACCACSWEWILIGVLTAVCRKREAAGRRMLTFYLFQPASIFCILEGMVSRSVSGFPVFYGSFAWKPLILSTRRETSELLARISVRLYRNLLYWMVCFAFFRACIPVIGRRKCPSGRFCSACALPCMEAGLEP